MRRVLAISVCCAIAGAPGAVAAGCGGGERQDASERRGAYEVEVLTTEFAEDQSISRPSTLRITVRNSGDRAIPNVAVSLAGLFIRNESPGTADPQQPVWVIEGQPTDGETAFDSTWALGRLAAGDTREFTWSLNPAIPGTHEVTWTVAAGLHGTAVARTPDGERPTGTFTVRVSDRPAQATVDPETGDVVSGDGEQ
ncbi:MAG TPA: hypothetical protein VNZ62_18210 [Capillimicrobium sp.]|nr:hypothetical protein [Capillimicrobium sp.]